MSAKSNDRWAWVLSAILVYVFLAAAVVKLAGARLAVEEFRAFGYPQWLRHAIAGVEIAGAILLLLRKTAPYAAALLGMVMIGAAISHLVARETLKAFIPLAALVLLGVVGRIRWRERARRLAATARDSSPA
jgi:putative oxidoreductase